MVLGGLGKGGIEIEIGKHNYVFGEKVKGRVILKLNDTMKARALKVAVVAERTRHSSKGRRSKEIVYNFEKVLDHEKDYNVGTYDFEIEIPAHTAPKVPEGLLGTIMKFLTPKLYWHVKAYLDVPMGFDVYKEVDITVTKPQESV